MASLTDTLPTSNASYPVIQPVQAPDYFGTIANTVGAGLKILGRSQEDSQMAANRAASEVRANRSDARAQAEFEWKAQDRAAKDALASFLPELTSADQSEVNRLARLGNQGDMTNYEMRTRQLYSQMAAKYGPSSTLAAFKDAGIDNTFMRQYNEEQAIFQANTDAQKSTIATFSARADAMGLDPSLPQEVRQERARQSLNAEYNYNIAIQEANKQKSLAEQKITVSNAERTANSEALKNSILGMYAPYSTGLIDQIHAISAGVQDDTELISKMSELGPNLQSAIDVAKAHALQLATAGNIQDSDLKALTAWFDVQSTLVKSAIDGDLSKTSTLSRNLKILQDSGNISNWKIAPEYMRFRDAVGDAGTGVIVGMIASETFGTNDESRKKLQQGFIDLFEGRVTDASREAQGTLDDYASVKADPSKMQVMTQKQAQRVMEMSAQALPDASKRFVMNDQNATAQDDFFETARTVSYSAASVAPSTMINSRDSLGSKGYVENVLALATNKDFNGAILKLEKSNPAQASIIRDNMSQALFNAFYIKKAQAEKLAQTPVLVDYTPGGFAGEGYSNVPSYSTDTRELKYDKAQGKFVGKNMEGSIQELNQLLDLRDSIERQRGSLESVDERDRRTYLATNELSNVGSANASDVPTDTSARDKLSNTIDQFNASLQQNILNPDTMVRRPPTVGQLPSDFTNVSFNNFSKTVQEYGADVIDVASMVELPPQLLMAMMQQESNGDPSATSIKGAVGLMQLMPDTAKEVGVTDATNPRQSIEGGAKYMKMLTDKYNGNLTYALMAYNWGPGNVDKWLESGGVKNVPQETQDYVTRIMKTLGYDF